MYKMLFTTIATAASTPERNRTSNHLLKREPRCQLRHGCMMFFCTLLNLGGGCRYLFLTLREEDSNPYSEGQNLASCR